MKVDLIDHMGDDLTVVNAARVSFDKESEWQMECCGMASAGYDGQPVCCSIPDMKLSDKDTKLIQYLSTHGHWSPFSHPQITFRIKAPIFVARQLAKHQVGLAWNEVSRRYVDSEPEFYMPEVWRKRAANVKQGSSDEAVRVYLGCVQEAQGCALDAYKDLLDQGVAPEQARMILPQSMYTEWYWTGSLYAFARVCKLRLDAHAQAETREVAQGIAKHLETLFPVSWKALMQ